MGKRKIIYMKVTRDKYRLPVAVADSPKELAALCGTTPNAIYSGFSHEKRGDCKSSYVKVVVDDDEE